MAAFQLLSTTRYDPFLKSLPWNNDNDGADPSAFFLLRMHFARLVAAARLHGWADEHGNSVEISDSKDGHRHGEEWLKYDVLKPACMDEVWEQQSALDREERATAAFRVRITVSKDSQIGVTATRLPAPFTFDPTIARLFKSDTLASSSLSNTLAPETGSSPAVPFPDTRPIVKVYLDTQPTPRSLFTETKTTHRSVYDGAKARVSSRVEAGTALADWDVLMYSSCDDTLSDEAQLIMETSIFNIAFFRAGRWLTPSATRTGCLPGVMRQFLLDAGHIEEDSPGELTISSMRPEEWVLLFNGVQGCRLGRICAR